MLSVMMQMLMQTEFLVANTMKTVINSCSYFWREITSVVKLLMYV